jgi:hypothetical protein
VSQPAHAWPRLGRPRYRRDTSGPADERVLALVRLAVQGSRLPVVHSSNSTWQGFSQSLGRVDGTTHGELDLLVLGKCDTHIRPYRTRSNRAAPRRPRRAGSPRSDAGPRHSRRAMWRCVLSAWSWQQRPPVGRKLIAVCAHTGPDRSHRRDRLTGSRRPTGSQANRRTSRSRFPGHAAIRSFEPGQRLRLFAACRCANDRQPRCGYCGCRHCSGRRQVRRSEAALSVRPIGARI